MITKEHIENFIKENGVKQYEEFEGSIFMQITDGYGIVQKYKVENKCPKCGAKFIKIGEHFGCYDGEWTSTDYFTCENKCCLSYQDIREMVSKG